MDRMVCFENMTQLIVQTTFFHMHFQLTEIDVGGHPNFHVIQYNTVSDTIDIYIYLSEKS
jgi:hypothetical protein